MSTIKVSSTSKKIKKSSSSPSRKQKKKSPHEPSSSSVQKSGSNRIFSDEDVIKILEAVYELPAEDSSREPNVAAGLILEGIQKSMTIKISQTQLWNKLRKLRKNYCQDPMKSLKLKTPHEERVFDLCNKIWVGQKKPEKKILRSSDAGRKQQIQELQNYLKWLELVIEYQKRVVDALASSSKNLLARISRHLHVEHRRQRPKPARELAPIMDVSMLSFKAPKGGGCHLGGGGCHLGAEVPELIDGKLSFDRLEGLQAEDDIDDEQAEDESVGDDDNKNEQSEDVDDEEEADVDSDDESVGDDDNKNEQSEDVDDEEEAEVDSDE